MAVRLTMYPRLVRGFAIRMLALCWCLCMLAGPAAAGDFSLLINGKAIHLDSAPGVTYNERNWGAGLQYEFDPVADGRWVPFLSASGFLDSNENPSYYAGGGAMRRYPVGPAGWNTHFDLGVIAFLMTRENFHDGDPFFGALPVASFGTRRLALNMTYIPKVDPKMVPILFFQIKVGIF